MSDAFISYSRKDAEFVQRLNTAFVQANRVVWVDWQDIPRGEDWWREIERGVEDADAFICVLSEHWLTSEICHRELNHARANHKRVVPLIRQKIEGDVEKRVKGSWMDLSWEQQARDNWDYLRHLNWVFFEDDARFETEFAALLKTLESDQPHIKAHTRYQNLALEWERSGQNPSYLLSGDNLVFAENWLKEGADKDPKPTPQHQQFIGKSRQAEEERAAQQAAREGQIRRFRRAAAGLGVVGVLAVMAAVGASVVGVQSQQAASTATVAQGAAVNAQGTAVAEANEARGAASIATLEQGKAQNAAATATVGQGVAVNTQIAAETRAALANNEALGAGTRVAVAEVTLTSVPPVLTDAAEEQDIGLRLADASFRILRSDSSGAIRAISFLVNKYPDNPLAYISRGIIYLNSNQPEFSINDFNTALKITPQNPNAFNNRGLAYRQINDFDKAIADFTSAIQFGVDFADAYYNRGWEYAQQKYYEKAIADFTKAISIDPFNTDAYFDLGNGYYELGRFNEAISSYSKAIALNNLNSLFYHNRGNAYFYGLGLVEAAMDDYNKAIELEPNTSPSYYLDRGNIYLYGLNDSQKAIADYSEAVRIDPSYLDAYYSRGTAYYDLEQYEAAIEDYSIAIKIDSDKTYPYLARGYVYFFSRFYTKALADWALFEEKGGQLSPEDEQVRAQAEAALKVTPTMTATP